MLTRTNVSSEIYGGPSQPEISDPRGTVQKAHRLGKENEDFINPGQYENENVSIPEKLATISSLC